MKAGIKHLYLLLSVVTLSVVVAALLHHLAFVKEPYRDITLRQHQLKQKLLDGTKIEFNLWPFPEKVTLSGPTDDCLRQQLLELCEIEPVPSERVGVGAGRNGTFLIGDIEVLWLANGISMHECRGSYCVYVVKTDALFTKMLTQMDWPDEPDYKAKVLKSLDQILESEN